MTEKNFKHIRKKDTSSMDMGKKDGEKLSTYLFEFGDNGTVHSAVFKGRLGQEETDGLFEFLNTALYHGCPEAVLSYLEQQHLEYTDFKIAKTFMGHNDVMQRAEMLLGCCSCDDFDIHIDNADYYYGMMDYQKWLDGNCCEGCYYAVRRTCDRGYYSYRIVGQTFSYEMDGCLQEGHFAIRTDDGERKLHSLAETYGEPVLPAAGCVNIHAILADIDGIHTAPQALNTALR